MKANLREHLACVKAQLHQAEELLFESQASLEIAHGLIAALYGDPERSQDAAPGSIDNLLFRMQLETDSVDHSQRLEQIRELTRLCDRALIALVPKG